MILTPKKGLSPHTNGSANKKKRPASHRIEEKVHFYEKLSALDKENAGPNALATKRRKVEEGQKAAAVSSNLEAEIKQLQALHAIDLEELRSQLLKKEQTNSKLTAALKEQESKLDNYQVELTALRAVYDEQTALVADLKVGARLSTAVARATRLVDRKMVEEKIQSKEDRIHQLQREIERLQAERKEIVERNEAEKLAISREEQLKLQDQISSLQEQVQRLNAELQNRVGADESRSEIAESYKATLEQQRIEIMALQEEVEDLRVGNRFNTMLLRLNDFLGKAQLAGTTKANQTLSRQLKVDKAALESDLRAAQRELDEAKVELSVVQRAFHTKLSEVASQKVQIMKLQTKVYEQEDEIERLQDFLAVERKMSAASTRASRKQASQELHEMEMEMNKKTQDLLTSLAEQVKIKDSIIEQRDAEIAALKKSLQDEKRQNAAIAQARQEQELRLQPLILKTKSTSAFPPSPYKPSSQSPRSTTSDTASKGEASDAGKASPTMKAIVKNSPMSLTSRRSSRLSQITVTTPKKRS